MPLFNFVLPVPIEDTPRHNNKEKLHKNYYTGLIRAEKQGGRSVNHEDKYSLEYIQMKNIQGTSSLQANTDVSNNISRQSYNKDME